MKTNLFHRYINLGVHPGLSIISAQRVKLTNILGLIPLSVYAYYVIYGLYFKVNGSILIAVSFLVCSLLALLFNARRKYNVAKFLLILCSAASNAITYNAYNVGDAQLMIFFPILLIFLIMFDPVLERKAMLLNFLTVTGMLIATICIPRYYFFKVELTPDLLVFSRWLCILLSFSLFIVVLLILGKNAYKTVHKLEDAKEQAEQGARVKSQFLSTMSHELRTPLNGIIGATHLLLQAKHDEQQKGYFDILKFSSDNMLHLVDDILTFNKAEAGKIILEEKSFNLKKLLDNITGLFVQQFEKKEIELVREYASETDMYVKSDELRLSQILNNLLSNAVKFTRIGHASLSVRKMGTEDGKTMFRFEVADTGVGIKPENKASIFESFTQAESGTTRKYGGTGLGLSISKSLIELFGGKLSVESEYKKGSRFYFDLQLTHGEVPVQVIKPIVNTSLSLKGLKVLAAEDNPVNMTVLSRVMKRWDAELTTAVNGVEMLQKFQQAKYDVLLIDLEMPEMDGYTALKHIRINDPHIPAYAFSAAVYENMEEDLDEKGFTGFIPKPFKQEDLFSKLEMVLQQKLVMAN
jgi:signal transduction histidine kinase